MAQIRLVAILVYCLNAELILVAAWSLPRMKAAAYSRQYIHWRRQPPLNKNHITSITPDLSAKDYYQTSHYSYKAAFEKNGLKRAPWMAPPLFWKLAYRLQLRALPVLYAWENKPRGDGTKAKMIPNSSLSLPILWWKALMKYPNVEAASWAYDLLPPKTRWIFVKLLGRLFPRFHHVNIQLRTTFLDDRVASIVQAVRSQPSNNEFSGKKHFRLVVLGAGYDLRATRFLHDSIVDEAIELDLPEIIQAKTTMLESDTFQKRRPGSKLPIMHGVDLNNIEETAATLSSLLATNDKGHPNSDTYTIFLLEGILVHLESGSAAKVLKLLSSFCNVENNTANGGCLLFCDWIEGVKNRNLGLAKHVLHENGWELREFLATPTKTPHFGVAVPRK